MNRGDEVEMCLVFFVVFVIVEFMMRVFKKSLFLEDLVFVWVFVIVEVSLWVLFIFGKSLEGMVCV